MFISDLTLALDNQYSAQKEKPDKLLNSENVTKSFK